MGHAVEVIREDVEGHVGHDLGDGAVIKPGVADFSEVAVRDLSPGTP